MHMRYVFDIMFTPIPTVFDINFIFYFSC